MNIKELRDKSVSELKKEVEALSRAHFSLRMQKSTQQLSNTSLLRKTRKDIARAYTVLNEQRKTK